jgi:hypothetical protein
MKQNKAQSLSRDRSLIAAIGEHFTSSTVLTLDGQSYKAKELQQLLQDHGDAVAAADAVKAKWQTAVAAARAKAATVAGVMPALRRHVISTYGANSQVMADFGFTMKQGKATVEVKAAALAKSAATREARGTKGKRQKAKIKGVVAPETVAPAATASTAPESVGTTPKPAETS